MRYSRFGHHSRVEEKWSCKKSTGEPDDNNGTASFTVGLSMVKGMDDGHVPENQKKPS